MNGMNKTPRMADNSGFSLTELSVVIVVVASFLSLALTNYNVTAEKTRSMEGIQTLTAIYQANQLFVLENDGNNAGSVNDLDVDIIASTLFDAPNIPGDGTAQLDRANGDYRLYVDAEGNITCDDDGFAGARNGICVKIGIAEHDI